MLSSRRNDLSAADVRLAAEQVALEAEWLIAEAEKMASGMSAGNDEDERAEIRKEGASEAKRWQRPGPSQKENADENQRKARERRGPGATERRDKEKRQPKKTQNRSRMWEYTQICKTADLGLRFPTGFLWFSPRVRKGWKTSVQL